MELHYFTFGIGHTFAGHVQPIVAESERQALEAMFQTYGRKWAFHYTEKQWMEARERGFAKERPLDLIDARKVILCTQ